MRQGFSLVELSIVLVILGLLVGGVLSGQSLIRAAELRKLSTNISKYETAVAGFRDKYFVLPGDMPNATSFWGSLGGGGMGSGCFTVTSTDTKTCNGDGNGFIGETAGATGGSDNWFWGERFHVWKHLTNAGLIEGSYTALTDGATNPFLVNVGKNIPNSGIAGLGVDIYSQNIIADGTSPYYFIGFDLTRPMMSFRNNSSTTAMTTAEAWNIDTKFDDGKPGSGKVWTLKHTATPCADSDTAATANYDLGRTDEVCSVLVKIF